MLEGDESSGKEQRGEPGWGPGRGEACPSRCLHRERIRGGAAKRPTPVPEKCSCLFHGWQQLFQAQNQRHEIRKR